VLAAVKTTERTAIKNAVAVAVAKANRDREELGGDRRFCGAVGEGEGGADIDACGWRLDERVLDAWPWSLLAADAD